MAELAVLEGFCLVGVTGEAEIVALCHEELRNVPLVRVVTGGAVADGNRAMDEFGADHSPVMAKEAELSPRLAELELIRGLVRVVARGAFPRPYRGMDDLAAVEPLVAVEAQLARVGDGLELVVPRGNMAGGATAAGYRSVDEFVFPHSSMAFIRYARFGSCCGLGVCGAGIVVTAVRDEDERADDNSGHGGDTRPDSLHSSNSPLFCQYNSR